MKRVISILIFFIFISNHFLTAQEKENIPKDQKNPILTSKFQIGVGMFIPTQTVRFSVDGSSDNAGINFDETFDFKNSRVRPEAYFDWRFAKFWNLGAHYFNAGHSKKAVLEKDIEAGDYTFGAGSNVEVGYKLNVYRILVGRVIASGSKYELGGGLGFHVLNIGPYIEGNVIINENDNEFQNVSVSATAPLPNITFWFHYAPTYRWSFSARFDWFGITVDEFGGSLWDFGPSVRFQIIKNLAVGVDYRYFKINANVYEKRWEGGVDMSFNGPSISVIGNF